MKHSDPRIDAQVEALNKLHGKPEYVAPPKFERKVMPPPGKSKHKKSQRKIDMVKSPHKEVKKTEIKVRDCLTCRKSFSSEGPGNRMCVKCRRLEPCPFEGAAMTGRQIEKGH